MEFNFKIYFKLLTNFLKNINYSPYKCSKLFDRSKVCTSSTIQTYLNTEQKEFQKRLACYYKKSDNFEADEIEFNDLNAIVKKIITEDKIRDWLFDDFENSTDYSSEESENDDNSSERDNVLSDMEDDLNITRKR